MPGKKKSKIKIVLITISVILAAIVLALACIIFYLFGNINDGKDIIEDVNQIGQGLKTKDLLTKEGESADDLNNDIENITELDKKEKDNVSSKDAIINAVPYNEKQSNILLIGVDSRDPKNVRTNTDVLMILSINQETNDLKITSIQRDLLVYVPARQSFHKINSVLYAGPQTLLDTLNYNYKLDLQKYVIVNISAAEKVVDILGGIELDVPNDPKVLSYWNDVLDRTNKDIGGEAAPFIESGGKQLLNGRQAITYARLRKLDTDFKRMKRQQLVLQKLFSKLKQSSYLKMAETMNTAFSYVTTNMSSMEIAGLASSVLPNLHESIKTMNIPLEGYYKGATIDGIYYTLQRVNDQLLPIHQFIYSKDVKAPVKDVEEYYPEGNTFFTKNKEKDKEAEDHSSNFSE